MPISYEKIKARKAIDPEYAAKQKSYAVAYKERNKDKELERQRLVKAKVREKDRDSYNAKMREWTEKNKERLNKKRREKLKNDPEYAEKVRAKGRQRHIDNPNKSRKQNLKINYGITLEDYEIMYSKQSGKCLICNSFKNDKGKDGLVVDHCHTKGHVRGLLCFECNTGLGRFKDNIILLENAIKYLSN